MFTFLRRILARRHFCLPEPDTPRMFPSPFEVPPVMQMTTDSLDSYEEDSSEVEYDETLYPLNHVNRKYDPIFNKINLVSELKKHLIAFRDENLEKKWFLYYALITIEEIGFYPSGMPFSKQEILEFIANYATSLENEGYPITHYYKLLSTEFTVSSTKFELIAKTQFYNDTFSEEQDENGETLLHHAVRWRNFDLVDALIDPINRFNVNEQDFNGQTPIFATACHKNLKMFKKLLDNGAEINQKLLDKAVNKGNLKMIKWLTKNGLSLGNRNLVKKLIK